MVEKKRAVAKTTMKAADWTTLKGKFFHDFDDDEFVQHQGRIIELIGNDIAIIQYFEWFTGHTSKTQAVWLEDIVNGEWALYASDELMRDAYDNHLVKSRRE